MNPVSSFQ